MAHTRVEAESRRIRGILIVVVSVVMLLIGVLLMTLAPAHMDNPLLQQVVGAVGAFITTTLVLGFLYRVTVGPYDNSKIEERIQALLYQEIDRVYAAGRGYGFAGIAESLQASQLFSELKQGEILWWLDTYDPGFKQWLGAAEEALKAGGKVNMLVMDPDSPMLVHRAVELGEHFQPSAFKQDLTAFRDQLAVLAEKYPDALRLRTYKDLPCAPIYVVVDEKSGQATRAYSSYFLGRATGIGFPHFLWRQGEEPVLKELLRYVTAKWERSG